MLIFLCSSLWLTSLIFMMLSHPLSFGFILLIQTTLVSMITGVINFNYWFSYILFLIMIGGMLILFIYMTSVASNEKFKTSNFITLVTIVGLATILGMSYFIDNELMTLIMNNADTISTQSHYSSSTSLNKFMNTPSNLIMIMIILYLLLTLIAVVKITSVKYGPLRQKL